MSGNAYEMSVPADWAKYLYQTKGLFERKLLTWYLSWIVSTHIYVYNVYIYI